MVYPSIENTLRVLEQLCARVRAETWGRAATAPGCLSAHGHGTWGTSMPQDCQLQAARCRLRVGPVEGFGKARLLEVKKLSWRVDKTGAS